MLRGSACVLTLTAPNSGRFAQPRSEIFLLEQTRTELSESRTEIHQLRAMLLQELQKAGEPAGAVPGVGAASEQASGSPAGNSGPTQHEDAQSSTQIDQDD